MAKWLAHEVLTIIESRGFATILSSMSSCDPASVSLSVLQEHLVGVVCRLPDVLANRLGRQLKEGLFPKPYFRRLGEGLVQCLENIHNKNFKGAVYYLTHCLSIQ